MGNEVVRALAELQRRVDYLERPKTSAPTVPVLSSVTKNIAETRVAASVATQALYDANHITETQITDGAIQTPHLAANAIDGMTITGAVIRTDSGPPWIQIFDTSIRAERTDGVDTWDTWTLTPSGMTIYTSPGSTSQYRYEVTPNFGFRALTQMDGSPETWVPRLAMVADGFRFRDGLNNLRMKINDSGVEFFDASLNTTARIDGSDGLVLSGQGFTGFNIYSSGISAQNYLYANYFRTTTSAANLHRSSTDAQIYLVTSNGYNKLGQEPVSLAEGEALLTVTPKTWRDRTEVNADPDTTHRIPGFVAEDVVAASEANGGALDPLITTGADTLGTSYIGINYDRVAAYLIPLIRDLRDRVAALETP